MGTPGDQTSPPHSLSAISRSHKQKQIRKGPTNKQKYVKVLRTSTNTWRSNTQIQAHQNPLTKYKYIRAQRPNTNISRSQDSMKNNRQETNLFINAGVQKSYQLQSAAFWLYPDERDREISWLWLCGKHPKCVIYWFLWGFFISLVVFTALDVFNCLFVLQIKKNM